MGEQSSVLTSPAAYRISSSPPTIGLWGLFPSTFLSICLSAV